MVFTGEFKGSFDLFQAIYTFFWCIFSRAFLSLFWGEQYGHVEYIVDLVGAFGNIVDSYSSIIQLMIICVSIHLWFLCISFSDVARNHQRIGSFSVIVQSCCIQWFEGIFLRVVTVWYGDCREVFFCLLRWHICLFSMILTR